MILDVPIPGLEPWEQVKADPVLWHFRVSPKEDLARSLRDHGWRNVSVEVVANSGHQVVDEQPAVVADLLERYAAR